MARQLRVTNPDIDTVALEKLCFEEDAASHPRPPAQRQKRQKFSPFRLPRIPELPEISEAAAKYNSKIERLEDDAIRQKGGSAHHGSGIKAIKGKVQKIVTPLVGGVFGKPGIWLCSHCERYLDDLTPAKEDNDAVACMQQKLGIWPPFRRVPGQEMRQRKCASCKRLEFTILFKYYEADG